MIFRQRFEPSIITPYQLDSNENGTLPTARKFCYSQEGLLLYTTIAHTPQARKITFLKDDLETIEKIGEARTNAKSTVVRNKNLPYHTGKPQSYSHKIGFSAELGYAKLTGLLPDFKCMAWGDKIDFKFVEVKCSTWAGSDIELKVKFIEYVKKTPKVYVLIRGTPDFSSIEFIGSITRESFDKEKYSKSHGNENNWCAKSLIIRQSIPAFFEGNFALHHFELNDFFLEKLNKGLIVL